MYGPQFRTVYYYRTNPADIARLFYPLSVVVGLVAPVLLLLFGGYLVAPFYALSDVANEVTRFFTHKSA